MKNLFVRTSVIAAVAALSAGVASAQTTVALPDTSQTTTLTANVSEQARVTVPAGITFNVTNTSAITTAAAASVTVDNIALATATKQLAITITPEALSFTSAGAGATWVSSDVTWNAATFSNAGVGSAGVLAGVATDQLVATCAVNVAACSTTTLAFSLAAKPAVVNAGNHTLVIRWKFASIGA